MHGQKEVILLLEQLPKETVFPTEILRVYRAIYNLVKSGTSIKIERAEEIDFLLKQVQMNTPSELTIFVYF